MKYQIYYQRFFGLLRPRETKLKYLNFTHRLVTTVAASSPDEVYTAMQGENWSASGEARPLIVRLNLGHTSMSVGDVIKDARGNWWVCNDIGWLPLRTEQFWPQPQLEAKPRLWMATEANFQKVHPQVTRLKITDEPDCLPADAYTVERFGWVAFTDLVALAKLLEQRWGLEVCIDLGDEFYETEASNEPTK